jgi:uncharacterized protein (TIGR03067 family)
MRLLFFCGGGLLALLLVSPLTRADITTPIKSWNGQLENPKLAKLAPAGGVIGNPGDFARLWKAWMGKDKLPEINFEKEFVAVVTSTHIAMFSVVLSVDKGDADAILAKSANNPKDRKEVKGVAFAIGVFRREGITTVNGNALPSADPLDDLRREVQELRARVDALERQLSEPELKALQGTWKVSKLVKEGKAAPAEELEKMQVVIQGDKFTFKEGKDEALRLSVNSTRKPIAIDLNSDQEGDRAMRGIYQLDKDVLKICLALRGKPRPTEFSSRPEEHTALIILQRASRKEEMGQVPDEALGERRSAQQGLVFQFVPEEMLSRRGVPPETINGSSAESSQAPLTHSPL